LEKEEKPTNAGNWWVLKNNLFLAKGETPIDMRI